MRIKEIVSVPGSRNMFIENDLPWWNGKCHKFDYRRLWTKSQHIDIYILHQSWYFISYERSCCCESNLILVYRCPFVIHCFLFCFISQYRPFEKKEKNVQIKRSGPSDVICSENLLINLHWNRVYALQSVIAYLNASRSKRCGRMPISDVRSYSTFESIGFPLQSLKGTYDCNTNTYRPPYKTGFKITLWTILLQHALHQQNRSRNQEISRIMDSCI